MYVCVLRAYVCICMHECACVYPDHDRISRQRSQEVGHVGVVCHGQVSPDVGEEVLELCCVSRVVYG